MSLTVKSGVITIQNALGQTKFTSNDRLVYQKVYKSGQITINPGDSGVAVPFSTAGPNDFLTVAVNFSYIETSAAYADISSSTINKWLPANGTLMVNIYPRQSGTRAICSAQSFGVALIEDTLYFKRVKYSSDGYLDYPGASYWGIDTGSDPDPVGVTLVFEYIARLFSYL